MTAATDTGQHRVQTLDDRVMALETCERSALAERASISTLTKAAAGIITLSAAGFVGDRADASRRWRVVGSLLAHEQAP